ncbi:MAG TPA: hypothetical protein VNQ73_16675 [Ilumatobacter sp.]|nr:hypothetical protein [Ilumatobacter sp.]
MRAEFQTRSHHNGRYYDVCAGTIASVAQVATVAPEQISLF